MYAKLFSSIVHSSIWLEDLETKVLWITMMALMDRQGCVYASVGGLARTAGIDPASAKTIIEKFLAPDPDSTDQARAPEREGRRLEVIDGGWRLLNAAHYRAIRDADERREQNRQAQARARSKYKDTADDSSILRENLISQPKSAAKRDSKKKSASEAEAEAEERQIRSRSRSKEKTLLSSEESLSHKEAAAPKENRVIGTEDLLRIKIGDSE